LSRICLTVFMVKIHLYGWYMDVIYPNASRNINPFFLQVG
jgi:hypothetical protein